MRALCFVPLLAMVLFIGGVIVALCSHLSLSDLMAMIRSPEVLFALGLSLRSSLLALGASMLLAIPTAWLMTRVGFPGRTAVTVLLDLPLAMPPLVAGVGLLLLFSPGLAGGMLGHWGLAVLFSPAGIIVAQVFVAAPVMIQAAKVAFIAVDPRYVQAASTLGASPVRIWFTIELPLAARGIVTGAVMGWSRALGEFGATLLVAGATRMRTETLPIAVFLNLATGDTGAAVACALLLLALAALLLIFIRLLGRWRLDS
ncbi:ABC transporter permease subunit [Martelella alba]|uniref:ABC transporter permease subunit n=1 Tax=Martelella alba TaxID=2590451 RepID=A0ABY2SF53_9HYPH|nr:ABC transporter permease subunit [Martelella alba]